MSLKEILYTSLIRFSFRFERFFPYIIRDFLNRTLSTYRDDGKITDYLVRAGRRGRYHYTIPIDLTLDEAIVKEVMKWDEVEGGAVRARARDVAWVVWAGPRLRVRAATASARIAGIRYPTRQANHAMTSSARNVAARKLSGAGASSTWRPRRRASILGPPGGASGLARFGSKRLPAAPRSAPQRSAAVAAP